MPPNSPLLNTPPPSRPPIPTIIAQVVRKRPGNETQMSVKEKFAKIASASMTNYQGRACVLRHRDGSFSILDGQSFLEFTEVWPPSDPNILAVQAYVQGRGNQGTIFRSKYSVVNSSGRVSLQHSSFLSMPPGSEEEATVKIGKEVSCRRNERRTPSSPLTPPH